LKLTVKGTNLKTRENDTIVWTSSNPSVATVAASETDGTGQGAGVAAVIVSETSGVVQGIGEGMATITVRAVNSGVSVQCAVVVEKSKVEAVLPTVSIHTSLKGWIEQLVSAIAATTPVDTPGGATQPGSQVVPTAPIVEKDEANDVVSIEEPEEVTKEPEEEVSAIEEEPEEVTKEPEVEVSSVEESKTPAEFQFDFETGTSGWTGTPNGAGTFKTQISKNKKHKGEYSLQVTMSGNTEYTLYGPDANQLKPGDLIEFWVYTPNVGIKGLTFFSEDAVGGKDTKTVKTLTDGNTGLVMYGWTKVTFRMNMDATAPFVNYGISIDIYGTNTASFYLDEIKINTDTEVKQAPDVPGLNKGVNLFRVLEEDVYRDIVVKDPLVTRYQMYLKLIKAAGFDHVRLPLYVFDHVSEDGAYTIDPDYLESVDMAIDAVISEGLTVILCEYGFETPYLDDIDSYGFGTINEEKMIAAWGQLASHYSDYPNDSLYFELINEPLPKPWTAWNKIAANIITEIRKTNPTRQLIVPTLYWNSIHTLNELSLPEEDRNLIVAIHFYDPIKFTQQGINTESLQAALGTRWEGTEKEKYAITDPFNAAVEWAIANDRPIIIGEFGVFNYASAEDRIKWIGFLKETMEERNLAWTYWEFTWNVFLQWSGLYNLDVLDTLIPGASKTTGLGFTEAIKLYWGQELTNLADSVAVIDENQEPNEEPSSLTEPENKDIVEPTEPEIDDESGDVQEPDGDSDGLTDSAFGDESDAEETFSDDGDVPKGEMPKTEEGLAIPLWVWLGSGALLLLAIGRKIAARWRAK
jgi:endoglucanase